MHLFIPVALPACSLRGAFGGNFRRSCAAIVLDLGSQRGLWPQALPQLHKRVVQKIGHGAPGGRPHRNFPWRHSSVQIAHARVVVKIDQRLDGREGQLLQDEI